MNALEKEQFLMKTFTVMITNIKQEIRWKNEH